MILVKRNNNKHKHDACFVKIEVIAFGRIREEKYYLYKALIKISILFVSIGINSKQSTYHSLQSRCDLGVTRILKDWGYDAKTEGCGINIQEVVVILNFGHNLGLALSMCYKTFYTNECMFTMRPKKWSFLVNILIFVL
jgi:hypothetical protein